MMFLDCPAYLGKHGAVRCGFPAHVSNRFTLDSSDGPLECATIRCPVGHWFSGPVDSLALDARTTRDPGEAGLGRRPAHGGRPAMQAGLGDAEGRILREDPARPRRYIPRAATAPAYYLGRPAWLWMTVMSTRRGGAAAVLATVGPATRT